MCGACAPPGAWAGRGREGGVRMSDLREWSSVRPASRRGHCSLHTRARRQDTSYGLTQSHDALVSAPAGRAGVVDVLRSVQTL